MKLAELIRLYEDHVSEDYEELEVWVETHADEYGCSSAAGIKFEDVSGPTTGHVTRKVLVITANDEEVQHFPREKHLEILTELLRSYSSVDIETVLARRKTGVHQ